ncbi:dihydropteroate synthase [Pararhodobacter sp.]|uniref:dihydropteroate synthase n=1 Tax=Pararhodobacter sp. TaxID=2127056 RepID=UPI002AFE65A5|nr:dihydropteroate synthase [Pararhodobacter sp.]
MTYRHARPRTDLPRPPQAQALAGSAHVWFDTVERVDGTQRTLDAAASWPDLARPRAILPNLPNDRPLVMGIVNVTPDSFSDGGTAFTLEAALARACAMVAAGADILDIGGESTRPGAQDVPVVDEIARTVPVIMAIRASGITTPISIDTRKARVAEAALGAGADMINDVSALGYDPDLAAVAVASRVPICLMHAQGTPQTMQSDPRYDDVLTEVYDYLAQRIDLAVSLGVDAAQVITDPGIGFGKTKLHNLTLLRGLSMFHSLGAPILLGASRKRFIGTISGVEDASLRMPGSVAVALMAAGQGAQILRVHDVAETVQALALWRALTGEGATT